MALVGMKGPKRATLEKRYRHISSKGLTVMVGRDIRLISEEACHEEVRQPEGVRFCLKRFQQLLVVWTACQRRFDKGICMFIRVAVASHDVLT